MANEKNLKNGAKTQFKSGEEAAKNGQKGGIASGIKRKEQATYRELAKTILATTIKDKDILAQLEAFGITDDTVKALTLLGLIKASAQGSHNAFDRLLELAGEKDTPTDQNRFNEGMQTLANLIKNPASNRNITDFEDSNDD